MARNLAASPDVGCALEVAGTLGRRSFKGCDGLLVVLFFPFLAAPVYDYVIAGDGRKWM